MTNMPTDDGSLQASSTLNQPQRAPLVPAIKIGDIVALCIKYWYWILLFLIVCMVSGWLMVKRTVPLYARNMQIVIRDDAEGGASGALSLDLRDLGFGKNSTILEDEMEALRSPDLMEQVIVALNLTTTYRKPGTFHSYDLYGSGVPVRVSFPDMQPEDQASFTMKVSKDGQIDIGKIRFNKDEYELADGVTMAFGDAIMSPGGKIIIQKTPFFKEGNEYEIEVTRMSMESARSLYSGEVTVDDNGKKHSNVLELVCVDPVIQRADDILTMLLQCYNKNWIQGKAEVVVATNEFINQRLVAIEDELSGVDNSISSYKSDNLIPDLYGSSEMYMKQSNELSNQIMNYTNQLQMARYLKSYISGENKFQLIPINTGLPNPTIETMVAQYNNMLLQRNSLLESTFEANPLVVDLDARLAQLRSSIISGIDNSIVSLSNTIAAMEKREQSSTAKVAATPQQAKYLLSAERKQKVQENLYLYLLEKREENELLRAAVSVNTRVLRRPNGSNNPTTPRPKQTYMLAFIIGLVTPVGLIYLLEISNTKLRGRKDLEGVKVPVIGEIPRFGKSASENQYVDNQPNGCYQSPLKEQIVVHDGNRNLVNEAIRVMRSNLTRMRKGNESMTVMITSFNPGSGKTLITMNLGISLALKHNRVLLIDGDLRRASLSKFVGSPKTGFADYLSERTDNVDSLIKRDVEVSGLDILPVGLIPPNPTELLESQRFLDMFADLKKKYDYILIDCPPGEMMADAHIIGEVSDRTLFVVRVGVFQRAKISELERIYQSKKYPNMMLVINGSETEFRFSYSYGYGYSRAYGYSHKDKK